MKLAWLSLTLVAFPAASSTDTSVVDDVERRVDELLSQMTLEEKVAQMAGDTPLSVAAERPVSVY